MSIQEILNSDDLLAKKALFLFNRDDSNEAVRIKFNLWARYFFSKYFTSSDAEFHKKIDSGNIESYRGQIKSLTDIAFRGAAKTSRTKLFVAFVILNDRDHYRKYIKCLAEDTQNSKQIVTDVYNMLVSCNSMYPDTFAKTHTKREETMGSFTTSTGIKVVADTVGTDQRGALQDDSRPDWILFEDFETRKTLRSAVLTKAIWDNMEEARTSLSKDGSCIYNCNYLSERGNVHKLVGKESGRNKVLIIPIIENGVPTWPSRYTVEDIEQMKNDDDDFAGERLCKPSVGKDILFDREKIEKMPYHEVIQKTGNFKQYFKFDPSHRVGSGHDISGGVGLDSATSVFIDFDTVPCRVVATFKDNETKPDIMGYEIKRQQDIYPGSIAGIEKNNHGHTTIAICKQEGVNLYYTQKNDTKIEDQLVKEYGWHTNSASKPKMMFALVKAVDDGLIDLVDEDLKNECKSYSRDDLMDKVEDPRLTTRHFDLLIACCIAWQMKDFAQIKQTYEDYEPEMTHPAIGV